MLRLLGKASSINVRKVLWTCAEIGVAVQREDWGSGFAPTDTADFLALNPNGLVPVLVDRDGALWESNTICRYLADRHGRADLLPAPSRARALVEQWMDWQATDLNASWRQVFMARVRGDDAFADPVLVAQGERAWNRNMGILDRRLAQTGAFVAGNAFCLADIVLGLSVNRWLMTPMDRPDLPGVAAYADRLKQRPGALAHAFNGIP
jgi:glutathione S-transferase